jgi:hypothetical protein
VEKMTLRRISLPVAPHSDKAVPRTRQSDVEPYGAMETARMTEMTKPLSRPFIGQSRQLHGEPTDTGTQTHATPAPHMFLNNDEAAQFLNLSPRTLEKQRVIGGGPRFRKFGRRVLYAVSDLEVWANARSFETTSDPDYATLR